jgi:hypothetical protein
MALMLVRPVNVPVKSRSTWPVQRLGGATPALSERYTKPHHDLGDGPGHGSTCVNGEGPREVVQGSTTRSTEDEEVEEAELMTFAEVEELVTESARELLNRTGVDLPRLGELPRMAEETVECRRLGITMPHGSLFYPCSGDDIDDAIESFGACVADFHFADPHQPPMKRVRRSASSTLDIPHVVAVVQHDAASTQVGRGSCVLHLHEKDGLLTLIENVELLSVFYYRGDSYGEGGSNQRWLEPVLFHTLLAKLLNGGLIVTDGSNCGSGNAEKGVPWATLCGEAPDGRDFRYAGRRFACVSGLGEHRDRPVYAWQVTAAT